MSKVWTRDDLLALIANKAEEDSSVEFKAPQALENLDTRKSEMAKDVSAMANAAGGVIIYGMCEAKGGIADRLEGCPARVTTGWIEQVLTGGIEPKIQDIEISRVDLEDGTNAFVVTIPQAKTFAPHQAKYERKYYRRYNTQALAMLDHEVRDLMRRGSSPEMFAEFGLSRTPELDKYQLRIDYGNKSSEPALYSCFDLWIDAAHDVRTNIADGYIVVPAEMIMDDIVHQVRRYTKNFIAPTSMPIFAERIFTIFRQTMLIEENKRYPICYAIMCPGFKTQVAGVLSRDGEDDPVIIFNENIGAELNPR